MRLGDFLILSLYRFLGENEDSMSYQVYAIIGKQGGPSALGLCVDPCSIYWLHLEHCNCILTDVGHCLNVQFSNRADYAVA